MRKPVPFKLLDLTPIHRANLAGQCRILMGSGLIVRCNIVHTGKGAKKKLSVFPAAHRSGQGNFTPILEFSSAEVKEAWEAYVWDVLEPMIPKLFEDEEVEFSDAF